MDARGLRLSRSSSSSGAIMHQVSDPHLSPYRRKDEKYTVGLVQMYMTPDPGENLERALQKVREAADRGAEIVCLPELFQTQYFCQKEDSAYFDLAEPIPGPTTTRVAEVAREKNVVVIASLFEKRARGLYHN